MKSVRFFLYIAVFSATTLAFSQSNAQKSFENLKDLAGTWEGTMDGKAVQVTLRVTSLGNAVLHEMRLKDSPEDPITMMHLDHERLMLTHYCDAGNQPRMTATISPDGKTITFKFIDGTNILPGQMGHMQRVVFGFGDADHHTETWDFALADGKADEATVELKRVK